MIINKTSYVIPDEILSKVKKIIKKAFITKIELKNQIWYLEYYEKKYDLTNQNTFKLKKLEIEWI